MIYGYGFVLIAVGWDIYVSYVSLSISILRFFETVVVVRVGGSGLLEDSVSVCYLFVIRVFFLEFIDGGFGKVVFVFRIS